MDEGFYFTTSVNANTTLSIAPIVESEIEASGEKLDDESGYFLVETKHVSGLDEVRIIARLASEDAAIELSQMLNME